MRSFVALHLLLIVSLLAGCSHTPRNPETLSPGDQDKLIVREGLRWIEVNPLDVDARILTGNAAWRLGDKDLAWEIWSPQAESIVAKDLYLGRLLIKQAQQRGEGSLLEKLLAVDPPGPSAEKERELRQQQLASILQQRHLALDAVERGDEALRQGDVQRTLDFYKRAAVLDARASHRARLLAVEAWSSAMARGMLVDRPAQEKLDSALALWPGPPVLYLDILTSRIIERPARIQQSKRRLEGSEHGDEWIKLIDGSTSDMDDRD